MQRVRTDAPARFRGIDGLPSASHLRCRIPVALAPGLCMDYETDTLGGSGDRCPFLYSNNSCMKQRNIFCAAYYDNGDGLLIFPCLPGHKRAVGIRLPLTDSGHYLVRITQGSFVRNNATYVSTLEDEHAARMMKQIQTQTKKMVDVHIVVVL